MPTLYVTEQGALIEIEAGQVLVTNDGEVPHAVPAIQVDDLVLVGRVGLTTPAMGLLLDRQINVVLLTTTGRYRGRLTARLSRNVDLRRAQGRRVDDPAFCLAIGRAIVAGKIANQRMRCLHWDETNDDPHALSVAAKLDDLRQRALTVASRPALMGIEGSASSRYFSVFRQRLQPPWTFPRRTRRPPPDPVNALLSLLYTLLHESCVSALEAAGLDPTLGFLHESRYGRSSLALDLMEEFRPLIADAVVMTMLNKRMLTLADFSHLDGNDGCQLTRDGWRVVAEQYRRRLESLVTPAGVARRLSYRKVLEVQARQLRRTIEGKTDAYLPFMPR